MTTKDSSTCKVEIDAIVYEVNFDYELEPATRESPEQFSYEITSIYDDEGFEVTEEMAADLYDQIITEASKNISV
jgi:hypothetical protein